MNIRYPIYEGVYRILTLRRSANAMLYIKAIGFSTYAVIVL